MAHVSCFNLLAGVNFSVVQDLLVVFEDSDAPPSGESSRLHDPEVRCAIHVSLRKDFPELCYHFDADLINRTPHFAQLVLSFRNLLVFLELRVFPLRFLIPLLLVDVLEIGGGDLLGVPQHEGLLLGQNLADSLPISGDALLLVEVLRDVFQPSSSDFAAG